MFRLLALLCSLFFGGVASQLPEFAQQYRQRLGGAIDELNRIAEQFVNDAHAEGLDRTQALARYQLAGDPFLGRRGRSMIEILARLDRLKQQQAELDQAGPFTRLAPTLAQLDGEVARHTLDNFEPAVPVTQEGLGLGALGLLVGRLIAPIFGLSRRTPRRRFA